MSTQKVSWWIGMCLLDGPSTIEEIKAAIEKSLLASSLHPGNYRKESKYRRSLIRVSENLQELIEAGWVIQEGDRYSLTSLGRAEVSRIAQNVRATLGTISLKLGSLLKPSAASKATMVVQVILALIKLPAGLFSGSVGLLNDSIDTILDLLSSLLVYLGIRFNQERLVNLLLVISMLATGSFTLYEALHRFVTPFVPQVGWFSFAVALLSALAGLALWTYQRFVGIQSGLMALITESVDSRNHVFVAVGVTAGLAASLLHFGLLDMLIGLAVAVLILWSAIELAVDLLHSSAGEPVDLSHYDFWLQGFYEHRRKAYLRDWMLSQVDRQEVATKSDMAAKFRQAVDLRDNPWLKSIGLNRQLISDPIIDQSLVELFSDGWVVDQEPLTLSSKGAEYIKQHTRPQHKG